MDKRIERLLDQVENLSTDEQLEFLAQFLHRTGLNPNAVEDRVEELDEGKE